MHSRLQQQTMWPSTISVVMKTSSGEPHQGIVVHCSKVVQLETNISPHFGLVTRKNVIFALAHVLRGRGVMSPVPKENAGTYQQHQRKFS